jgi:hypothetical protein
VKVLKPPQSGSLAGVTASHNRFGQYERSRRSPVQPTDSARRGEVRQRLAQASAGFSALTNSQQEAWISYAASHPITDKLGQSATLTGHMMFVKINASLLNAGLGQRTLPPTVDTTFTPSSVVLTCSDEPEVSLAFSAIPADMRLLVAASRPQSAGTRFCKTFRQFTVAVANAVEADITAAYADAYGTPVENSVIFFRLTPINAEGVQGSSTITSAQVVAS